MTSLCDTEDKMENTQCRLHALCFDCLSYCTHFHSLSASVTPQTHQPCKASSSGYALCACLASLSGSLPASHICFSALPSFHCTGPPSPGCGRRCLPALHVGGAGADAEGAGRAGAQPAGHAQGSTGFFRRHKRYAMLHKHCPPHTRQAEPAACPLA